MESTEMLTALLALTLPIATALLPFWVLERRFRVFWAGLPLERVTVQTAPYRGARVVPGHTQRAPALVRWAALSSFLMGQMFIPGLLLGLIGLMAMGIGLISIPGLIIAARLWAAGVHLLKGTPDAIAKARSAARWSVQLNVLISIVCIAGGLFASIAYVRAEQYQHDDLGALLVLLGLTQAYALLSFGQAALIAHATRDLDSEGVVIEDVLPRWLRAALTRRDARRAAI